MGLKLSLQLCLHNFQADYQFSAEEVKALRECNTESFFQRSLPFGTGLGLLAYFGVKNGYLQGHVKYGAVPKVVMGVILGYFVGKFSYQQKCAEKIMRLPNSHLGELLRQRRQGGGVISSITPDENLGRAFTLAPFTPSSADVYSDEAFQPTRSTSLNLDTESRPTMAGLDDIYRPTLDCEFIGSLGFQHILSISLHSNSCFNNGHGSSLGAGQAWSVVRGPAAKEPGGLLEAPAESLLATL